MISSVGKHDPYGIERREDQTIKTEGSILGAVRELEPDILFLLPTREQPSERLTSTEANSNMTKEVLNKLYPKLTVYQRPLNLPDPTDYEKAIKAIAIELEEIKAYQKKSKVEYIIALSSGTSQIQAAFLTLVNSNRIAAKVYQTIAPRYVPEGEKRTREVVTHFLEEENRLSRAKKLMAKYDFFEAAEEILDMGCYTTYPEREKKAEIFATLLESYYNWDLYKHEIALEKLDKTYESIKKYRMEELTGILEEQRKVLQEIIALGDKEGYLNLADLYHNTVRRQKNKQYIDCLSRFKRTFEGVYYYVANKELKIQTKADRQPDWVKKVIDKKGYLNTYDISHLYELRKGERIIPRDLEEGLNELANKRNRTINNHGMKSVNGEDARKAVKLLEKLFTKVFVGQDINSYCFSIDTIKKVEGLIFSIL